MTTADLILALQALPQNLTVLSADDGTPQVVNAATLARLGSSFFATKIGDLDPDMELVLLS
jgi:hypothetical protein